MINIKNDRLIVKQKLNNYSVPDIKSNLILKGHSHFARVVNHKGCCFIKVPSLSDLNFDLNAERTLPGAFVMEIAFNNKVFISVSLKQLVIADKIYVVNEMILPLYSHKKGEFNNTQISEKSEETLDNSNVNEDKTNALKLNPHLELQPPVYVPPEPIDPVSLSKIKKRKYKWE